MDVAPSVLDKLGLESGDSVYFDMNNIMQRSKEDLTTAEGARQYLARQTGQGLQAQAGPSGGLRPTEGQGTARRGEPKMYEDGTYDFGDGRIMYPNGVLHMITPGRTYEIFPDPSKPGGVQRHAFSTKKPPVELPPLPRDDTGNVLSGEEAIKALSPGDQHLVRSMAEYRLPVTSQRGGNLTKAYDRLKDYVAAYKPDFDTSKAQKIATFKQSYMSAAQNSPGARIQGFNTAVKHAATAIEASKNLPGGQIPAANTVVNMVAKRFGKSAPGTFEADVLFVANELVKQFKGGVPDKSEVDRITHAVNANSSPEQIRGVLIESMIRLGGEALESLKENYEVNTDDILPEKRYIYPKTRKMLEQMGVEHFAGVDIKKGTPDTAAPGGTPAPGAKTAPAPAIGASEAIRLSREILNDPNSSEEDKAKATVRLQKLGVP